MGKPCTVQVKQQHNMCTSVVVAPKGYWKQPEQSNIESFQVHQKTCQSVECVRCEALSK